MTTTTMEQLKKGTKLKRGSRTRIILGMDRHFVYYQVPTFDTPSKDLLYTFSKWVEGAEIVQHG